MPIPSSNEYGFIRVGTHLVTFAEIKDVYVTNAHREGLWANFETFAEYLKPMECFSAFEFYGSFFSAKEEPGDIDVALEFRSEDRSAKVDPLIFDKEHFKETLSIDVVIKEPINPAYNTLVPETYTFSTRSLYTFRRLKREEQPQIARILQKPPFEFWQDEFKGVLRVEVFRNI